MAFYQRASKLAFLPASGGAAAAVLGSRCTSSTTNQKMNQVAISRFTGGIISTRKQFSISFPRSQYQRRFASSTITKEATTKTTINSKTTSNNGGNGFVQWYEGHLQARPVMTKAITGSILWGVGDVVAQVVPTYFDTEDESNASDGGGIVVESSSIKKEFKYDFPRTARAVTFGFALHAPLSHLHFNFLEWMTVKGGFHGLSIPVFKTVMEQVSNTLYMCVDMVLYMYHYIICTTSAHSKQNSYFFLFLSFAYQFVYWSWISNSLYHGAMGAMQGMNGTQIYDRIKDVLWDTQVAQWSFWIPVQLLNFQFVPVRHQLNVVLLTSVVWTALLSAWYPPEEAEERVEEKKVEKE